MLLPINRLIGAPIVSLQVEAVIGKTAEPIIDPRQLIVIGFYTDRGHKDSPRILHASDIREIGHLGLIVDSPEAIMPLDGLVRLQEVIDFDFNLIGLPVVDERGKNYGKVQDYTVDPKSLYVQQIYTHQSFLRSLSTMSNVIHRHQIVSVTNQRLVIKSADLRERAKEASAAMLQNPFRKGEASNHPSSRA